MSNKIKVLSIYKSLLRESQCFSAYNFREYALRRIKDAFKENKNLTDTKLIKEQMEYAAQSLDVIRRQTVIGKMYQSEKLVIEK